jgi:hypothetical protein
VMRAEDAVEIRKAGSLGNRAGNVGSVREVLFWRFLVEHLGVAHLSKRRCQAGNNLKNGLALTWSLKEFDLKRSVAFFITRSSSPVGGF